MRGIPDRFTLYGGRREVYLRRYGRPQCHGQPGGSTRQRTL